MFSTQKDLYFKVKDINNLIDKFRVDNDNSDSLFTEINHIQGYSPLLDLITNYTQNPLSAGMLIIHSIVSTICHAIMLLYTGKNRLKFPNIKYFIKKIFSYFLIDYVSTLIMPRLQKSMLDSVASTIVSDVLDFLFQNKFNFFFNILIKSMPTMITSRIVNFTMIEPLSKSRLCIKHPERIVIEDNKYISIYNRPKNNRTQREVLLLPNMKKLTTLTESVNQDFPTTLVKTKRYTYTLKNGRLFICLFDDDNDRSRHNFHSYSAPSGTTTFDVSLDEKHIAFLTPERVHLWKLQKSKPLDKIMNSEVDL